MLQVHLASYTHDCRPVRSVTRGGIASVIERSTRAIRDGLMVGTVSDRGAFWIRSWTVSGSTWRSASRQ
ncbi:MAG: hypothetical protein QOI68_684 [Pseudonocardiales bacterium]|nr:hypothetical protein [Pseudonocardiales bacterium]